jgi:hypothetical protein
MKTQAQKAVGSKKLRSKEESARPRKSKEPSQQKMFTMDDWISPYSFDIGESIVVKSEAEK